MELARQLFLLEHTPQSPLALAMELPSKLTELLRFGAPTPTAKRLHKLEHTWQ
jgi:hypothetical protein